MQGDLFRSAEVDQPVMVAWGAGVDSTAILFIVLFPVLGPALLWVLRTVLEALNGFGAGA